MAKYHIVGWSLLLACVGYVLSCTCPIPRPTNGCQADFSIRGRVRDTEQGSSPGLRIYTVYVEQIYKWQGTRPATDYIKVEASELNGLLLWYGPTFVISGSKDGLKLTTNSCEYTKQWDRIPNREKLNLSCNTS